jgi:glycosyltransferase involved in cell wall biosynthesis
MVRPKVSVIIPSYNSSGYLGRALHAIVDQSYDNIEVLVIDDGSADNTAEVVAHFQQQYPWINYYHQSNAGVSIARNNGLKLSTGKYVVFFDSDDLMEFDFLTKRVLFLENFSYYNACCSVVTAVSEKDVLLPYYYKGIHDHPVEQILKHLKNTSTCPSNYMIKSDILKSHHAGFDTELSSSADKYFFIQSSPFLKIGLIDSQSNCKLLYRLHPGGMSQRLSIGLLEDHKEFLKKVIHLPFITLRQRLFFRFKMYYVISGGYFKMRHYFPAFYYALLSALFNPYKFILQVCAA